MKQDITSGGWKFMQLRKISVLFKDYEMYKERYKPTKLRNLAKFG